MGDLTRNTTLPNESGKTDFHNLVDTATVADNKIKASMLQSDSVTTNKIADDNVTFAKLDDDGAYGLFTGDWSFNEIALVEDTAPSTAVGEGKLYTKDTGGQPELFYREESDGDEVQITSSGTVIGGAFIQCKYATDATELTLGGSGVYVTNLNTAVTTSNTANYSQLDKSITPTSASNLIKATVNINVCAQSDTTHVAVALVKATTIKHVWLVKNDGNTAIKSQSLGCILTADDANEHAFKVYVGAVTGNQAVTVNTEVNGYNLNGTLGASSLILEEVVAS